MSAIIGLPAALGSLILEWGISKYIEAAGKTPAEQLLRAQAIKAIVMDIDLTVLGQMSVSNLATATLAQLQSSNISVSTQILVNGLVTEISAVFPILPNGSLLGAANEALVDQFLKNILSVTAKYGA
jgi:hypothetical protein